MGGEACLRSLLLYSLTFQLWGFESRSSSTPSFSSKSKINSSSKQSNSVSDYYNQKNDFKEIGTIKLETGKTDYNQHQEKVPLQEQHTQINSNLFEHNKKINNEGSVIFVPGKVYHVDPIRIKIKNNFTTNGDIAARINQSAVEMARKHIAENTQKIVFEPDVINIPEPIIASGEFKHNYQGQQRHNHVQKEPINVQFNHHVIPSQNWNSQVRQTNAQNQNLNTHQHFVENYQVYEPPAENYHHNHITFNLPKVNVNAERKRVENSPLSYTHTIRNQEDNIWTPHHYHCYNMNPHLHHQCTHSANHVHTSHNRPCHYHHSTQFQSQTPSIAQTDVDINQDIYVKGYPQTAQNKLNFVDHRSKIVNDLKSLPRPSVVKMGRNTAEMLRLQQNQKNFQYGENEGHSVVSHNNMHTHSPQWKNSSRTKEQNSYDPIHVDSDTVLVPIPSVEFNTPVINEGNVVYHPHPSENQGSFLSEYAAQDSFSSSQGSNSNIDLEVVPVSFRVHDPTASPNPEIATRTSYPSHLVVSDVEMRPLSQ